MTVEVVLPRLYERDMLDKQKRCRRRIIGGIALLAIITGIVWCVSR